jgi:hypothetical protein
MFNLWVYYDLQQLKTRCLYCRAFDDIPEEPDPIRLHNNLAINIKLIYLHALPPQGVSYNLKSFVKNYDQFLK